MIWLLLNFNHTKNIKLQSWTLSTCYVTENWINFEEINEP